MINKYNNLINILVYTFYLACILQHISLTWCGRNEMVQVIRQILFTFLWVYQPNAGNTTVALLPEITLLSLDPACSKNIPKCNT